MVLKNLLIPTACAVLLACSGVAVADDYRPDQFFGLDLSKAVLSQKRLGPPAEFAPVPLEARTDGAQANAEAKPAPRIAVRNTRLTHRAEPPRGAARVKLAHHRGNPLDAQARDTRIQVWPCRTGGICDWKR